MERLKRQARTPFVSALLGGLVVAVIGLVAISAGLVKSDDDGPTIAQTPLTEPASDTSGGKGHTVNQIYEASAPGVAFVEAQVEPKESSEPFSPFGPRRAREAAPRPAPPS